MRATIALRAAIAFMNFMIFLAISINICHLYPIFVYFGQALKS